MAVGSDHAGFLLKEAISAELIERGINVLDLGTSSATEPVDWSDTGFDVGHAVASGDADLGIAICGSGIGVAIAANKVPGVRAATAHDVTSARLARQHNHANVLCLGERLTGRAVALEAVDAFLAATPGTGRHAQRVDKVTALESGLATRRDS
jgi:ribose 5-phosphate isomerase B